MKRKRENSDAQKQKKKKQRKGKKTKHHKDVPKSAKPNNEERKQNKKKSDDFPKEKSPKIKKAKAEDPTSDLHEDHPTKSLKERKKERLEDKLKQTLAGHTFSTSDKGNSLRVRMMEKLKAARFRYLNEQIYVKDGKEAQKLFKQNPAEFKAYHEGYRQQVSKWPLNPVDVVIGKIKEMPKSAVVADFGCGDAKLAKNVSQKVHSFDLVATNELVTACNMANVPLKSSSIDVAVFCLSLMGTNLQDYLLEANRVLKTGGILKIVEVESRFDDVGKFIETLHRFKFKNTLKDLSHNLFYFLDFKKESDITKAKKLPTVQLRPCLYKKR